MSRRYHIIPFFFLLLTFCACGNNGGKMPEIEQLKYENTLKKLEVLCAEASEAAASGNNIALENIKRKIQLLHYDFNSKGMDDAAKEKCQALKDRIDLLKQHPEKAADGGSINEEPKGTSQGNTLFSKKRLKLTAPERFAYSLKANDLLTVSLDCQGSVTVSFYDIRRKKRMRQWTTDGPMTDTVSISRDGIYMMEVVPNNSESVVNVSLSCKGSEKGSRRRASEKIVDCKKGDFLAKATNVIIAKNVFREPKKVGLRGNLKAYFSGKSRVVVPVTLPSGCDAILYSLRISTDEQTVGSDGKFAYNLNLASSKMKLFGVTLYERHTLSSVIINRLLFNTRPPREGDAYCNMYVMTSSSEARKFNNSKAAEQKTYKYDIDQSQMGTQSCNGRLLPKGHKTLYIGFENERMRYDNYIWFELVALTHSTKYQHPVYMAR